MKTTVEKISPTEISGFGRDPESDEFGFNSSLITNKDHEYYTVSWSGVPGESIPTVTRKTQIEIDAINIAREQVEIDEQTRIEDILAAQDTSGLKQVTLAQAEGFIDAQLDPVTTIAALKEACRVVLKKMVPYVLK